MGVGQEVPPDVFCPAAQLFVSVIVVQIPCRRAYVFLTIFECRSERMVEYLTPASELAVVQFCEFYAVIRNETAHAERLAFFNEDVQMIVHDGQAKQSDAVFFRADGYDGEEHKVILTGIEQNIPSFTHLVDVYGTNNMAHALKVSIKLRNKNN